MVAVVAALELDDLFAAGIAARHADGVHRRFGAGVGEAHQVAVEAALDLFGQDDAVLDRERVARAVGDALLQHLGELGMRVAGGQHAEGHVEVDVVVAVRVPDMRAAGVLHEQRIRVVRLKRRRDTERQRLLCPLMQPRAGGRARAVARLLALEDLGNAGAVDRGRNVFIG